jgi:hypothetical protein
MNDLAFGCTASIMVVLIFAVLFLCSRCQRLGDRATAGDQSRAQLEANYDSMRRRLVEAEADNVAHEKLADEVRHRIFDLFIDLYVNDFETEYKERVRQALVLQIQVDHPDYAPADPTKSTALRPSPQE